MMSNTLRNFKEIGGPLAEISGVKKRDVFLGHPIYCSLSIVYHGRTEVPTLSPRGVKAELDPLHP